jgi:hypothetical protein
MCLKPYTLSLEYTPHSSRIASLEFGAFYFAVPLLSLSEVICEVVSPSTLRRASAVAAGYGGTGRIFNRLRIFNKLRACVRLSVFRKNIFRQDSQDLLDFFFISFCLPALAYPSDAGRAESDETQSRFAGE